MAKKNEKTILSLLDAIEMSDQVVHDLFLLDARPLIISIAQKKKKASFRQQSNAIYYLGAVKDLKAERLLVQIWRRSAEESIRLTALFALAKLATPMVLKELMQVLKKPKAAITETSFALQLLGQIGSQAEEVAIISFKEKTQNPILIQQAEIALLALRGR